MACWNCADGLWAKRALLDRLDADLLVISEVRRGDFERIAPGHAGALYTPSASARGLAVFSNAALRQRRFRVPGGAECYNWVQVAGVDILCVWVKAQGDYAGPALAVVQHFLRNSRAAQRLALGDFNLNPGLDRGRNGRSTQLVAALAARGMRSLYHAATGEPMGAESRGTHHFTYNAARPFHIDYIFASAGLGLVSFGMGEEAAWIGKGRGDHLPLWAELRPDVMPRAGAGGGEGASGGRI